MRKKAVASKKTKTPKSGFTLKGFEYKVTRTTVVAISVISALIFTVGLPFTSLALENRGNNLRAFSEGSHVLGITVQAQEAPDLSQLNKPSWWNVIPENLRNFLELLYVLTFHYNRKSDLAYLLKDIFTPGTGSTGATGPSGLSPSPIEPTHGGSGHSPTPGTQPTSVIQPTTGTLPTANPTQSAGGGHVAGESHAMSAWSSGGKNAPNPTYDKCEDGTDIVQAHKTFYVVGPDGLKYPTWHAPVVQNPITGSGKCFFGHDHGRDPKKFQYFSDISSHFAYDENKNGSIESAELTKAGIPFGYVNEQFEKGSMTYMRHEDHVGHKVEYGNGEADAGSYQFSQNTTGGINMPEQTGSGLKPSGVSCYVFDKVHQGVSTPDAFTNNLHEVVKYMNCISTRSDYPNVKFLVSRMIPFGAPGEFTRFCGDNRDQIVSIGKSADQAMMPGQRGIGMRNIITRDCVESEVLVPEGQFSRFPYEIWSGDVSVTRSNSSSEAIVSASGAWEVLDAIRYYNPASANKSSYTAPWCYETIGGRKARGGSCDSMTNYGAIKDITWDDPRSLYRGLHRGQYENTPRVNNAGGPTYWYTDVFGEKASAQQFSGSIRQYVSSVRAIPNWAVNSRILLRTHDDGGGTVHAPN